MILLRLNIFRSVVLSSIISYINIGIYSLTDFKRLFRMYEYQSSMINCLSESFDFIPRVVEPVALLTVIGPSGRSASESRGTGCPRVVHGEDGGSTGSPSSQVGFPTASFSGSPLDA